jgi:mono/diheme cytochrome c family protein
MPGSSKTMLSLLVTLLLVSVLAIGQPTPKGNEPRGELLYSTYCVTCHTTQIHWREKRLAENWTSLAAQVRRWQANTGLSWSEDDILEVTRHLNALYYHFPETGNRVSLSALLPKRGR